MIVVISGPGGVGKGALVERLLERDPKLWLSRSWTTRDRRPGEALDAYVFTTAEQFQAQIDSGGFIEWVDFLEYRQGSPAPDAPDGRDVLFEIDVVGSQAIRDRFPEALTIFVDAPSRAVQEARLRGRGDTEESIARRLAKAETEALAASGMGSEMVINDDLDAAVEHLVRLIDRHRDRFG